MPPFWKRKQAKASLPSSPAKPVSPLAKLALKEPYATSVESFQTFYSGSSAYPLYTSLSGSTLVDLSDAEQSPQRKLRPTNSPESAQFDKSAKSPKLHDVKLTPRHLSRTPRKGVREAFERGLEFTKENAQPTFKLGLKLTKEASVMFPPLKAVAGVLYELMEIYDKCSQNNDSIRNTIQRVDEVLESLDEEETEIIDHEELLRFTRKLEKDLSRLQGLAEHGRYSKAVKAAEIENAILEISNSVDHVLKMYQVSINKSIFKRLEKLGFANQTRDLRDLLAPRNMEPMNMGISPCLPNTRAEVLKQIYDWASHPEHFQRVFWLKGHAGSGKSAIAMSFCLSSSEKYRVGASFFCCRDNAERCNVHNIFPSIAFQLASRYPRYRDILLDSIESLGGRVSSLKEQLEFLIIGPLQRSELRTIIVIDAIDECLIKDEVAAFVTLMASQIKNIPKVKFFITARPEDHIRVAFRGFQNAMNNLSLVFELQQQLPEIVNRDIRTFLIQRLSEISRTSSETDLSCTLDWPSEEHVKVLVQKSSQLFIFAATMVTFIGDRNYGAKEQLEKLVNSDFQTTNPFLPGLEGTLDNLYSHILLQIGYDYSHSELHERFRRVVGCIIVAFQALSEGMLNILCQWKQKDAVHSVIRRLHSVMNVPADRSLPIYLYHQSFRDYMTNRKRCQDPRFFVSLPTHHEEMAIFCLKVIRASLTRRNIYDSDITPKYRYKNNSDISTADRERAIGRHLEYACRFWTKHLRESLANTEKYLGNSQILPCDSELPELVTDFLLFRMIFWLEILSVVNDLDYALEYLRNLYLSINKLFTADRSDLEELVVDARRLVTNFLPCIRESASHIYHSALPLFPQSSLHSRYKDLYSSTEVKILSRGTYEDAKVKPRILDHHIWSPVFLKYSNDGNMVLIIGKGKAELLSVKSGKPLGTFQIDNAKPIMFSFSANTQHPLLVSSWTDGSVVVWDTNTCEIIIQKHVTARPHHVSFSPDGKQFAAVDENGIIYIWDTISRHRHFRFDMESSTQSQKVSAWFLKENIFIAYDGSIVKTWDTLRGTKEDTSKFDTSEGDTDSRVAELHSNLPQQIITKGNIVQVYDLASKKLLASAEHPHFSNSQLLIVSSDIRYVALSVDAQVKVYTIGSNNAVTLLASLPAYDKVTALAFSLDSSQLAFITQKNMHIWEVEHLSKVSVIEDRSIKNAVVALSSDGMFFATGFMDGTVIVNDISSGESVSFVLKDNFDRVTSPKALCFSPKSKYLSIVLEEQNRSACVDGFSVDVWVLEKRKLRHMNQPGESTIKDTSFLDDRVVLGFAEDRIEVWDAYTGTHLQSVICEMHLKLDSTTWIEPRVHDFVLHRRSESSEKRVGRVQIADHSAGQKSSVVLHEVDRNDVRASVLEHVPVQQKRGTQYPAIGHEWILNESGQRILWVPHEWRVSGMQIAGCTDSENTQWEPEERVGARWAGGKLAMLGPRGHGIVVDFNDVKVDVPTSEDVIKRLQYKKTTELFGLKRSHFLPVEKKK